MPAGVGYQIGHGILSHGFASKRDAVRFAQREANRLGRAVTVDRVERLGWYATSYLTVYRAEPRQSKRSKQPCQS